MSAAPLVEGEQPHRLESSPNARSTPALRASARNFEGWTVTHGGISLVRAVDAVPDGALPATDEGACPATYRSHPTELAWRSWCAAANEASEMARECREVKVLPGDGPERHFASLWDDELQRLFSARRYSSWAAISAVHQERNLALAPIRGAQGAGS